MSSWGYVAIAYTVGWGGLAAYAVLLARRVAQGQDVERKLRKASQEDPEVGEGDGAVCDAPPAP